MNKKIGAICILLAVLMIFPIVGRKVFTNKNNSDVTDAQGMSTTEDLEAYGLLL